MYRYLIRPLLFVLPPEAIHHLLVRLIRWGFKIPLLPRLIRVMFAYHHPDLKREFLGMHFDNPVGLAAGFDKNAQVVDEFAAFGFAFVEVGTVTPRPQPGNPRPRSFRLPGDGALINRMGFNNHGVEQAAARLKQSRRRVIIGGNIGKNTGTSNEEAIQDYHFAFEQLYDQVDYLVVNLSCPNIKNLSELQDKKHTMAILQRLCDLRSTKPRTKPILLKISPDLTDQQLDDAIEIFNATGIDGIIATNTTTTRQNLTASSERLRQIGDGGLSGAPLKDQSTRIIRYITEKSNGKIPIIGVGGIMSAEDALEKLRAGASLVQVYTGFIYNGPGFVKKINRAIVQRGTG
ncbi:MAG: quinone-dependent dihydroorotate dehydrogenase [Bacteroidales bacterium]|nr:quinone-dependent dihydroorotate dehydrogenase [Bacteroidales bacterium]